MRSVLFIGILVAFGVISSPATAQMRPGIGTAVISTQEQQANAKADDRLENIDLSARNRTDSVDWGKPDWLTEPAPGGGASTDPESETPVQRRAREVRQEANQRWYQGRINDDVPFEGRSYPEMAGWFTPEGESVPERWPWWLW
ncbi:MAG: hypothetical protein P8J45_13525 [Phycisphaerales bacterium]|jgi:hypothetical protein|nr:hypothetical protein [Phycisphaerales bacterium]